MPKYHGSQKFSKIKYVEVIKFQAKWSVIYSFCHQEVLINLFCDLFYYLFILGY